MGRLLTRGQELPFIEQVRGVVHDGIVGAVVGAQQDLAGVCVWVVVVESFQQGDVEMTVVGEGTVNLWADLKVGQQMGRKTMTMIEITHKPQPYDNNGIYEVWVCHG